MRAYEKEKAWRAYEGSPKYILSFIFPIIVIILIGMLIYFSQKSATAPMIGTGVGLFLSLVISFYIGATAPESPTYVSSRRGSIETRPAWGDD